MRDMSEQPLVLPGCGGLPLFCGSAAGLAQRKRTSYKDLGVPGPSSSSSALCPSVSYTIFFFCCAALHVGS